MSRTESTHHHEDKWIATRFKSSNLTINLTLKDMMGHNINIIIPLCCHLLVFCNCKQQIQSPYQLPYIKKAMNFQDEATKLLHEQHLKLLYVNIIKNLPKGIHKFT